MRHYVFKYIGEHMDYQKVENKEDFLKIIKKLEADNQDAWENTSAVDFIEALGAWLNDADGFYQNFKLDTDANNASWQLFADALQAATIYE